MNVRKLFSDSANVMLAKFNESLAYSHQGTKGTAREEILKEFLRSRIPSRFEIGGGQVVGPNRPESRQSDVIIVDTNICAPIIADEHVQMYPVEGVSGIIEVKSRLSKTELIDGLEKITAFKDLVPQDYVQARVGPTSWSRPREQPFGIIFAYELADNSLNSLQENLAEYDAALSKKSLSANLVVVLNEGLLVHMGPNFEELVYTDAFKGKPCDGVYFKHGAATLYEFYTRLIDLLINTQLDRVDLRKYRDPVERLGAHIVRRHDRLARPGDDRRYRLTQRFVESVFEWCKGTRKLSSNELNLLVLPDALDLAERFRAPGPPVVYLYNLENLPRPTMEMISTAENFVVKEPCLLGTFVIEIDGEQYAIPPYYADGNSQEMAGVGIDDL